MKKVLRKVKSQWAVLGIMGATVIALGAAYIPQISAAEIDGQIVTENVNDYLYSTNGKVITITGYQGTGGKLVIPSSIDGLPVTSIGKGAFSHCDGLISMTIPEGITSIGESAFAYCYELNDITIPEGVTNIAKYTFSGCTSLTSVTIPSSVISIENNAFAYCDGLIDIAIPEGVSSVGWGVFSGCRSLKSVTIPSTVISIGEGAFIGCSSLTNVEVSEDNPVFSSDAEGVLYDKSQTSLLYYPTGKMGGSFIIPEGVTSIGDNAFAWCSGLTSVTIPEGVTTIGLNAFSYCTGLTSIAIPLGVTSIAAYAFADCKDLTSVIIPEGVTNIDSGAFVSCSGLTSINIPSTVTSIGVTAFADCSSLNTINSYPMIAPITSNYSTGDQKPTFWGVPNTATLHTQVGATGYDATPWTLFKKADTNITEEKNAQIVSETAVDYAATVSRSGDGINTQPWNVKGWQTVGTSATYFDQTVEVSKEATTDYGVTWALISQNGQELGWVAKDALTAKPEATDAKIISETAVDYAATVSRSGDGINTQPWNVKGWQTVGTSATYFNQTVEVSKEATTDYGVTWALVSLNGQELGWVAKDALTAKSEATYAQIVSETAVDYAATVSRSGDGINTQPWNVKGWQTVGTSATYFNHTVEVSKEATTDYGVTWALVSLDGKELGWIAKDALKVQTYAQITKETVVDYPATISRGTDAINTAPWGAKGYQTIGSSAEYVGKTVDVTKEQVTDYGVTWAQISLNGAVLGWIAKDALKVQTYAQITKETAVDYPATISRGTDAINTAPWGVKDYQTVGSSAGYVGKTVDVTKEQVTDYGVTWAQISLNGEVLGWIAKDALDSQKNYAKIVTETGVYYPATITRGTDAINTAPWGTRGYQTIGSSAVYVGKTVDVTMEQVTDYGVTWAQISMNGEVLGWIAKDALNIKQYDQDTSETYVEYPAIIRRGTDAINTAPWGTDGSQTIGSSATYIGKRVDVKREQVTDDGVTWALVYLDYMKLGWIAKDALEEGKYVQVLSSTEVAYDAIVTRGTDGINDQPWGTNGFVTLGTSADYLDSLVNVVREEVTDNGVTWVLMYKDAHPIGWVDKAALNVKVYEGDQINRISLSEVQTIVDDISPYFETGIWDDRAHIVITGDYMDIYDNYDNNYMWDDYDSSVNQLINAIDERGWDGIVDGYWKAFKIYIPINQ